MTARPLTSGEVALARTVFGDSIRYDDVTIHDGQFIGFQPKGTAMAPEGNLYMYGCYRDDYAAGDPYARAHFIHEMTHVWQFQNKILHPIQAAIELNVRHMFNYLAAYAYTLEDGKDLTDYNMEQQASIVQDYFLLKHEGCTHHQGQCRNAAPCDERISLCEKILGRFLENPHYAKRDDFPKRTARGGKPRPPEA